MPALIARWVIGTLGAVFVGSKISGDAEDAINAAVPWIVGGAVIVAIVKMKGK